MSADDKLLDELKFLGIDDTTVELLAMLPLVQVAWADGSVQEEERELILELARTRYRLTPDAQLLLQTWLTHPPSERYIARGRRALVALAADSEDFDLDAEQLDDVVEFSKAVAKAAGGFMGFRKVGLDEALALEDIAAALDVRGSSVVTHLLNEEDVEDENTDIFSPEEMDTIRDAAFVARSTESRTLTGEEVADLVHHGANGGAKFEMDVGGMSIGRSAVNDVQIAHDARLSRIHTRILFDEGRFYIEDNDTTNGTWVNGERVQKRRLYGGEQIRVGGAFFTFIAR